MKNIKPFLFSSFVLCTRFILFTPYTLKNKIQQTQQLMKTIWKSFIRKLWNPLNPHCNTTKKQPKPMTFNITISAINRNPSNSTKIHERFLQITTVYKHPTKTHENIYRYHISCNTNQHLRIIQPQNITMHANQYTHRLHQTQSINIFVLAVGFWTLSKSKNNENRI